MEQYGILKFEDVNIIQEQSKVDFIYEATMLFCELSIEIAGHKSEWVQFGSPPRIHSSGEILEVLLKDDFERLDSLVRGRSRKLPWFHRRAQRVIAPFMKSEVHQEMVNADLKGCATSVIVEKVNSSLSEDYVKQALTRLRQTVRTATCWSSLKWTMGIALSSIPLIVSEIFFMERLKPHTMLIAQDHLVIFPWLSESNPLLTIAVMTIPLSFSGLLFAKWVSKRWIRHSGGKLLVDWTSRKGLLIGRKTAAATFISSALAASCFFSMVPMWIDQEGKLYGTLAVFKAPQIIEATISQPRKTTNRQSSRKNK
ncbi:MAG TPA: hypothetical protein VIF37_19890 [Methylobacter sp.]|jgi:hypothetical protein